jgi:hypothetical protein
VGTRYDRPRDVQFLQVWAQHEITPFLNGRAVAHYDARRGTLIEGRLGADIKWQCWSITVDYDTRHGDENEIRFAINLLGLGSPISTSVGLGGFGSTGTETRPR